MLLRVPTGDRGEAAALIDTESDTESDTAFALPGGCARGGAPGAPPPSICVGADQSTRFHTEKCVTLMTALLLLG